VPTVSDTSAWFCALGEPLNIDERATTLRYLQGFGRHSGTQVRTATHWHEARRLSNDSGWDQSLWQAEQAERGRAILERCIRVDL
jgi:hypothetical protein